MGEENECHQTESSGRNGCKTEERGTAVGGASIQHKSGYTCQGQSSASSTYLQLGGGLVASTSTAPPAMSDLLSSSSPPFSSVLLLLATLVVLPIKAFSRSDAQLGLLGFAVITGAATGWNGRVCGCLYGCNADKAASVLLTLLY